MHISELSTPDLTVEVTTSYTIKGDITSEERLEAAVIIINCLIIGNYFKLAFGLLYPH